MALIEARYRQRSSGTQSARQVQPRRYCRRPQEAHRCANGHGPYQDPAQEMARLREHSLIELVGLIRVLYSRYTIYKDHITLSDYEINDGMSLEMY
ncbi:hypothetical protein HMN09_00022600 [Mycena chlorophos]|uniref:Ubiquitin-like domain-containing protein n=1 Tax=Mycena chlorophos TaxID=658473 RepID=A0A8H6TSU0_MYCCL|nr:hypothetical protein HMN09_00022600 [Mycena chlorophos]